MAGVKNDLAGKNAAPILGFDIREADLPAKLGVSRDIIRAVRKNTLAEGVDWKQIHKDVMLNAVGQKKLEFKLGLLAAAGLPEETAAALGLAPGAEAPLAVVAAGDQKGEQGPRIVELIVLRAKFLNGRVITAHLPGSDPMAAESIVNVVVKDNRLFRPGMRIQAREAGPRRYAFYGRYPKATGVLAHSQAAAAAAGAPRGEPAKAGTTSQGPAGLAPGGQR